MPVAAVGWTAAAVVALGAAWPALSYLQVRALEKPAYTVLRKLSERSEVRLYAPYIIAEADIPDASTEGKMRNAMNQGFRSVGAHPPRPRGAQTWLLLAAAVRQLCALA